MINKYRVHEVAKDFDVSSKVILDMLGKHFEGQKKSMTALEENELDVIFESFTQENSVESFDAYFATAQAPKEKSSEEVSEPEKQETLNNDEENRHRGPIKPACKKCVFKTYGI